MEITIPGSTMTMLQLFLLQLITIQKTQSLQNISGMMTLRRLIQLGVISGYLCVDHTLTLREMLSGLSSLIQSNGIDILKMVKTVELRSLYTT